MSTSATHLAQTPTCVDAAIASLVEAERNRVVFSLCIMAGVAAMMCKVSFGLALATLAMASLPLLHHALTRYRVRAGLYGNNAAECEELIRHIMAQQESERA